MSDFPRIHQPGQMLAPGVYYLPEQRRALIFAGDLKAMTDELNEPFCEQAAVLAAVRAVMITTASAEATTIKVYLPADGPACSSSLPPCEGCKKGRRP